MLRAVIFDLDDTILDWSNAQVDWAELGAAHLTPICDYLRETGHTLPPVRAVADRLGEIVRLSWKKAQMPHWEAPRLYNHLHDLLIVLGINPSTVDMERLERLYQWGPIHGVRPFRDASSVLEALRAARLQLGLLTNAAQPMWMRDIELNAYGLTDAFDFRITAGDIGKLKPHPDVFKFVLEALNTSAEEAVYVGDRPHDDVIGAQSAGMRAILVRRISTIMIDGVKPNAIVNNLREIQDVFDLWYPGWRQAHVRR